MAQGLVPFVSPFECAPRVLSLPWCEFAASAMPFVPTQHFSSGQCSTHIVGWQVWPAAWGSVLSSGLRWSPVLVPWAWCFEPAISAPSAVSLLPHHFAWWCPDAQPQPMLLSPVCLDRSWPLLPEWLVPWYASTVAPSAAVSMSCVWFSHVGGLIAPRGVSLGTSNTAVACADTSTAARNCEWGSTSAPFRSTFRPLCKPAGGVTMPHWWIPQRQQSVTTAGCYGCSPVLRYDVLPVEPVSLLIGCECGCAHRQQQPRS